MCDPHQTDMFGGGGKKPPAPPPAPPPPPEPPKKKPRKFGSPPEGHYHKDDPDTSEERAKNLDTGSQEERLHQFFEQAYPDGLTIMDLEPMMSAAAGQLVVRGSFSSSITKLIRKGYAERRPDEDDPEKVEKRNRCSVVYWVPPK